MILLSFFPNFFASSLNIIATEYIKHKNCKLMKIYYEDTSVFLGIDEFFFKDILDIEYSVINKIDSPWTLNNNVTLEKIGWQIAIENKINEYFDVLKQDAYVTNVFEEEYTRNVISKLMYDNFSFPSVPLKKLITECFSQDDICTDHTDLNQKLRRLDNLFCRQPLFYIPYIDLFNVFLRIDIKNFYFYIKLTNNLHEDYISPLYEFKLDDNNSVQLIKTEIPKELTPDSTPDKPDTPKSPKVKPLKPTLKKSNKANFIIFFLFIILIIILIVIGILIFKIYVNYKKIYSHKNK
ncbi:hypothetical protein NUSPORA_01152 [Nucleospora cyclopteri]